MQINLKQTEIETALKDYIAKLGISLEGREVGILFTNGRKSNGLTADIDISDTITLASSPIPSGPISREAVNAPVQTVVDVDDEPAFEGASPATTSLFGG